MKWKIMNSRTKVQIVVVLFSIVFCKMNMMAQTFQDSLDIMKPIDDFFIGMKTKDTALIRAQIFPYTKQFVTFVKTELGDTKINPTEVNGFLKAIVKDKASLLEEKIFHPKIKVDDVLATVWVDYEFWYNNQKLHTGVDAFTLVKMNRRWWIYAIVDTRKKL
jgi:hypothetical protein